MAGILQRLTTPFGGQQFNKPAPTLPGQTQLAPASGAPLPQPKMVQNLGIKAFSPTDNLKNTTPVLGTQNQSSIQQNNPAAGQNTGAPTNPVITAKTDPSIAANGTANNIGTPTPPTSPSGILNTLVGTSQGQAPLSPVVQQAMDKYNALAAQSAAIGSQGASAEAGQRSTGTTPVAEGNAAITAQTVAAQQGALGQQEQAALAAGNLGVTGQATQQSGLVSALTGAQQTTNIPYDQQGVYTATGQSIGGGGVALQSAVQQALQQIKNGAGYTNAINGSGLSHFGPAGITALQQALPQGFNINQSDASASAQANNINTAGTAVTSANAAAYAANLNPYLQLKNTVSNVDQFGNLLISTMQDGGINPFDVKYANQTLAQVRGELSSAQQATFDNTYASLKSRVSGLLATGGAEIPTQITADANKVLDGSLPLQSLSAVLTRIGAEGQILLQNQANLVNTPLQTATGSTAGQVGTPTSDYQSYLQAIGGQ